jgi:hypothetical protein
VAAAAATAPTSDAVARFREELSARRPTLAASLDAARLAHADGVLTIELPGDDPLSAKQLERASNRELLGAAAAATFGAGTRLRLVAAPAADGSEAAAPPAAGAAAGDDARPPAVDDPRVQAVLDIFGGSVEALAPADDEETA